MSDLIIFMTYHRHSHYYTTNNRRSKPHSLHPKCTVNIGDCVGVECMKRTTFDQAQNVEIHEKLRKMKCWIIQHLWFVDKRKKRIKT